MTYCPACGCRAEPVEQPSVHGWVHACRHRHAHLIPYVISEKQREQLLPREGVEA